MTINTGILSKLSNAEMESSKYFSNDILLCIRVDEKVQNQISVALCVNKSLSYTL